MSPRARVRHEAKVKAITSRERTFRSPTSFVSSTLRCEAGPPTSGTACRRRPLVIWTISLGTGFTTGSAGSIAKPTGSIAKPIGESCDTATWEQGRGLSRTASCCSNVQQCR